MEAIEQIEKMYGSFNRTQRRIADYILQHPDLCAMITMRKLAEAADTTDATILSFSRRLGYSGFSDMKTSLQRGMSDRMLTLNFEAFQNSYSNNAIEATIDSEKRNLREAYEEIDSQLYEEASDLIMKAKTIYAFAYDFSPVLAEFFTSRFMRLGVSVRDLSHLTTVDALHELSNADREDLIVLFSFPAYSQITIAISEYYHRKGNKVLCFANNKEAPIAAHSDILISCASEHMFFFNSMTSAVMAINILAAVFISRHEDVYKEKMRRFNDLQNYLSERNVLHFDGTIADI